MMDADRLRQLEQEDLNSYLKRRLRFEDLDPPLNDRFQVEPPEAFILEAYRQAPNAAFRSRVITAIRVNLDELLLRLTSGPLEEIDQEYLASLAFLASELQAKELVQPFYSLASALLTTDRLADQVDEGALFHLLRQIARLQQGRTLVPFWHELRRHIFPSVRTVAWYGLASADAEEALSHLRDLADDVHLALGSILWQYATGIPGIERLGVVARRLDAERRGRLRAALEGIGADQHMLAEFDKPYVGQANEFQFPPGVFPKNMSAARRPPHWYQKAA